MSKSTGLECAKTSWQGRSAYVLRNEVIDVVVLRGGGHIAVFRFRGRVGPRLSPLWVPPWRTIDPQRFRAAVHARRYGRASDARLLAGIAGHSICLDYFGPPSAEQATQGFSFHGEAPNCLWRKTRWRVTDSNATLEMAVMLPAAGLNFTREIKVRRNEPVIYFRETVINRRKVDHAFHWVQHVTLGPPFLARSETRISIPALRAKTDPNGYDEERALLARGREFDWPLAPGADGGSEDLSRPLARRGLGCVAAMLIDPTRAHGYIAAHNTRHKLLLGYAFRRRDFPWVTLWLENRAISAPPWKRRTEACGLEFGSTPLGLPRAQSDSLGCLFDTPTLECLPARSRKTVRYVAFLAPAADGLGEIRNLTFERDCIRVWGSGRPATINVPAGGLEEAGLLDDGKAGPQ